MNQPSFQLSSKRPTPKIGLVVHSIGAFNPQAKDDAEKAIRRFFDRLVASGKIDSGFIITKRIFDPHEALAAADRFSEARVDLAVIANVAFPNRQVYLTLGAHPHLAQIPLAAVAEPEPAGPEWETNAWGGVIMNNHLARREALPRLPAIGTLLSGKPAACLDWVNYTGGSDIIQLGHCGMGICGLMESGKACDAVCDAIALHPVIRQAGGTMGPVLIGQFEYGPKTGLCLTRDPDGSFKLLAFSGDSTPETARGMTYSAADVRFADYAKLNRLVLDGGFPHHLAVAMGDIREDLRMLCMFLGIEQVSSHD